MSYFYCAFFDINKQTNVLLFFKNTQSRVANFSWLLMTNKLNCSIHMVTRRKLVVSHEILTIIFVHFNVMMDHIFLAVNNFLTRKGILISHLWILFDSNRAKILSLSKIILSMYSTIWYIVVTLLSLIAGL